MQGKTNGLFPAKLCTAISLTERNAHSIVKPDTRRGDPADESEQADCGRGAQARRLSLFFCGHRPLLLIERIANSKACIQIRWERRLRGERITMSNAYIIEIQDRAAGIVTRDGRGFSFFSSERAFDRLEGRVFRSVREAERAAQALVSADANRRRTRFA
jgi:hypothetical protein